MFILICSGPAMATEQNSSTSGTTSNLQSNQTTSSSEADSIHVRGYWINTGSNALNCLNVSKLKDDGITDLFISTNKNNVEGTLAPFLNKFSGSGIKLHTWISCFKDNGQWYDPGTNKTLVNELTNSIVSISENYNVDGIHLDSVRYPGTAYQYNGTEHVTSFVKNIYDEIQIINNKNIPGKHKILLSAALMPEGYSNGYYYGQDYGQLAPYLDFMAPMIYKGNYNENTTWIATTTQYIVNAAGGTPVIAGILTYRSDDDPTPIPSSELSEDILAALDKGSSGFILFRYGLIDGFVVAPYSHVEVTEILTAANWVNNYINEHGTLPSAVSINTINGTHEVEMPIFLSLLTRGLLHINNGDVGLIRVTNYNNPSNPPEIEKNGTIQENEYINMAEKIVYFMGNNRRAPNYSNSNIGNISYKQLIEMYSYILNYYRLNGVLPDYFSFHDCTPPIVTKSSPSSNAIKIPLTAPVIITFSEYIKAGANYSGIYLKNTISGVKVSMTKTITGNTLTIKQTTSRLYNTPYQVYIPAGAIKDTTGNNLAGTYTYKFTTIPKPQNLITIAQLNSAAASVSKYYETHSKKLPSSVKINSISYNMAQLLYLLTTATINMETKNLNPITAKTVKEAPKPSGTIKNGNIVKTNYLSYAKDIQKFINTNRRAPNFVSTNLGNMQFKYMVYMYSKVVNFYISKNRLPNFVAMTK